MKLSPGPRYGPHTGGPPWAQDVGAARAARAIREPKGSCCLTPSTAPLLFKLRGLCCPPRPCSSDSFVWGSPGRTIKSIDSRRCLALFSPFSGPLASSAVRGPVARAMAGPHAAPT
ncbi:hypothetical protein MC885_000143 [Smutsia gigantea]|nr:hypothetical protein MC885_000143 [Smutsia gigantea]